MRLLVDIKIVYSYEQNQYFHSLIVLFKFLKYKTMVTDSIFFSLSDET